MYSNDFSGCRAWNLGTGVGSTVLDIIHAFNRAVGRELPYEVAERRAGDVLNLTAVVTRANEELKWKAEKSMEQACVDLWRWAKNNPTGYREAYKQDLLDGWKLKA